MAYCALSPVSVAIYTALNVSAVTDLATGGVYDDPPQNVGYPFVWYTVREEDGGALGTTVLPEVECRVHVFSQYEGLSQAQDILFQAVQALRYTTPAVTGYSTWLVVHESTRELPVEIINGVKTHHLMGVFRITVEESAAWASGFSLGFA